VDGCPNVVEVAVVAAVGVVVVDWLPLQATNEALQMTSNSRMARLFLI